MQIYVMRIYSIIYLTLTNFTFIATRLTFKRWFSGLSCPWWDPPPIPGPGASPIRRERKISQLYNVARAKLLRYNFILITELLQDPAYTAAIERYFGVPGVTKKKYNPLCELESKHANERIPLLEETEPIQKLMQQNVRDVHLYHELKHCLEKGNYDFPALDPNCFDTNETYQVN